MTNEKMKHVEFEYCGHLDDDSYKKAAHIAWGAYSEENAWAEVDKLDSATREAIYSVGTFVEYD